jgi:hypothetical protein
MRSSAWDTLTGSESGACFAGSHSPWTPPFAPPAPLRSGSLYSSASQLLWQSPTSRDRASSATANRLPDAHCRGLPNGRSRDLPVPARGASTHASSSITPGRAGARDDGPVRAQRLPVSGCELLHTLLLSMRPPPIGHPFNGMRMARTFSLMHVTLKVVLETALRVRDVRSR